MNEPFRQHPERALWAIGGLPGKFYWLGRRDWVFDPEPVTPENFDRVRRVAFATARENKHGPELFKLVWDGAAEERRCPPMWGMELRSDQTGPVLDVGTWNRLTSWTDVAQWLQVQNDAWAIRIAVNEGEAIDAVAPLPKRL